MRPLTKNEWWQIIIFLSLLVLYYFSPDLRVYFNVGAFLVLLIFFALHRRGGSLWVPKLKFPLLIYLIILSLIFGAVYEAIVSLK